MKSKKKVTKAVTKEVKEEFQGSIVRIEKLRRAFRVTPENYELLSKYGFDHYYVEDTKSTDNQDNVDTSGKTND